MPTISLRNIRAGTLQDARSGSIMLPLGDYSEHFLVTVGAQEQLFGVFLTGQHRFYTVMASKDGDNWAGFFIDDVRVEVDIDSASDATHHRPPIGAIVRRRHGSFLVALAGERTMLSRRVELRLDEAQAVSDDRAGVAFSRWGVVTGEGPNRVVLHAVEAIADN